MSIALPTACGKPCPCKTKGLTGLAYRLAAKWVARNVPSFFQPSRPHCSMQGRQSRRGAGSALNCRYEIASYRQQTYIYIYIHIPGNSTGWLVQVYLSYSRTSADYPMWLYLALLKIVTGETSGRFPRNLCLPRRERSVAQRGSLLTAPYAIDEGLRLQATLGVELDFHT